jgi:hypothetical protein
MFNVNCIFYHVYNLLNAKKVCPVRIQEMSAIKFTKITGKVNKLRYINGKFVKIPGKFSTVPPPLLLVN